MPANPHNSRREAASIIRRWMETGMFLENIISPDAKDRAFLVEVTYGVVRHKSELEWLARNLCTRPPDPQAVPFLLAGLYQVFMMDNVEEYALVNETVEAVKSAGLKYLSGFVNAILRNALRQKADLLSALARQPVETQYSHPQLLVMRWTARYGSEKTVDLCRWNNSRPSVTIRVRSGTATVEETLKALQAAGINAAASPSDPGSCIDLPHGIRVTDIPGFQDGLFMIQDASTLVPVRLLSPQPGEEVLDACAAPGGKTIFMAELMKAEGCITAMDISPARLRALEDNCRRMNLSGMIKTATGDASAPSSFGTGKYDAVLLDAPCTNTGVIRRRPEARWRFSKTSLAESALLQAKLLDSCSTAVKPGGRMVYSTCSIEPEEGEKLVERWLNKHGDFELAESRLVIPPGSDGGYAALLRMKKQ